MLQWRDQGIIVALRRHGENAAIVEVLSEHHGRHAGVLKGGQSAKLKPHLQLGNFVEVTWKARLEEHLGHYTLEPLKAHTQNFITHPILSSGLSAFCAMAHYCLPERLSLDGFYKQSVELVVKDDPLLWSQKYVAWELELLRFLGFGLDLETCALSGAEEDLTYISPRTGRAVARAAAQDWAPRLFLFPEIFKARLSHPTHDDILDGLRILDHFLARELHDVLPKGQLPAARARFCAMLEKAAR